MSGEALYERYKDALKRGHVASLRGRLEEALTAYAEAAAIAPERSTPHTSAGTALMRRKRPGRRPPLLHGRARASRRATRPRCSAARRRSRRSTAGPRRRTRTTPRRAAGVHRQAGGRGRRRAPRPRARRGPRATAHAGAADRAAPGVARRASRAGWRSSGRSGSSTARPSPRPPPAVAATAAAAAAAGRGRRRQPRGRSRRRGRGGVAADGAAERPSRAVAGGRAEAPTPEATRAEAVEPSSRRSVPRSIATSPDDLDVDGAHAPGRGRDRRPGPRRRRSPLLLDLAAAYRRDGRIDAALDACYLALSLDPDDVALHLGARRAVRRSAAGPSSRREKLDLLDRLVALDDGRGRATASPRPGRLAAEPGRRCRRRPSPGRRRARTPVLHSVEDAPVRRVARPADHADDAARHRASPRSSSTGCSA